jgi:hypothetical protein
VGWLTLGRSSRGNNLTGKGRGNSHQSKFRTALCSSNTYLSQVQAIKPTAPTARHDILVLTCIEHFDLARPTPNFPPHRLGVIHLSMSFHMASIAEPQQLRPCVFSGQTTR